MRRRNGFTLIELLVVIAIIGILAAIIFPVYAQAKKSAYKSSDLSNMNSIRSALLLYKSDTGAFPPALLGYIGPYQSGSTTEGRNITGGNIIPPSSIRDALYPKRVDSVAAFRPALDRVPDNLAARPFNPSNIEAGTDNMVTTAYWPNGLLADSTNLNKQRFGPTQLVQRADYSTGACQELNNYYYRVSGYDVAPATNQANAKMETHYQLFWSAYSVPATPCDTTTGGGSASDTPRQLGYSDPPETTVVTWNGFFRDYDANGNPLHQKQDLVLFLGGSARPMDSANVATQAWAVTP